MRFQKISTPTQGRSLEIPRGGGGGFKRKFFERKLNYEAKLELPGVGVGLNQKTFCGGGMDIFWNHTLAVMAVFKQDVLWFTRWTPGWMVWVPALARAIVLCSWQDTLLSQCISPPRSIKWVAVDVGDTRPPFGHPDEGSPIGFTPIKVAHLCFATAYLP